jgi:hypothetical protein
MENQKKFLKKGLLGYKSVSFVTRNNSKRSYLF